MLALSMNLKNRILLVATLSLSFNLSAEVGSYQALEDKTFDRINDFESYAKESGFGRKVLDKLSQANIRVGARIFNISSDQTGLSLAAKYKREVEAGGVSGYWLRSDSYELKAKFDAGDFLSGLPVPVGLGLSKGTKLKFIRPYTDHSRALLEINTDENLKKIPFNSQIAMEQLEPGDYFSMQAKMNLFAGFSGDKLLSPGLNLNAKAFYILSGEFLVQTFKMKDQKIRVRLFAENSKNIQTSGGLNVGPQLFKINIGNSIGSKIVEKIIDFDLMEAFANREKGRVMVLDYIFDLNTEVARQAYDDLLTPKLALKDAQIAKDLFKDNAIQTERLLSNAAKIELIAKEDANKENKRIEKTFNSEIDFTRKGLGFDINLLVSKYERSRNYTENKIVSYDHDGEKYFFAPTFSSEKEFGFDIGIIDLKSRKSSTFFSIFNSDPTQQNLDFSQVGMSFNYYEHSHTRIEEQNLHSEIKYNLPIESHYDQFESWDWPGMFPIFFKKEKEDVNYRVQFFINKTGLEYIQTNYVKLEDFQNVIDSIYRGKRERHIANPLFHRSNNVSGPGGNGQKAKSLAKKLYRILSLESDLTSRERVDLLMEFRSSVSMRKYLPYLVKRMIKDKDVLERSIYLSIEMSHSELQGENAISYQYGSTDSLGLYKHIRALENSFNEDDTEAYILFRDSEDEEEKYFK